MDKNEIMNALESIIETLYEVDTYDKDYYEQVIGEVMDLVDTHDGVE